MSARTRCSSCGSEWPASIAKCYKCGQPLGGGFGAAGLESYGSWNDLADSAVAERLIGAAGGGEGAYREGNKLVMIEGGEMPRRCPICNSEEVDFPTDLTIARETKEMGGISGLIKAGADAIAGWDYTGPVSVSVYFCDRHSVRFRNRLLLGGGIALAGLLYLLVAYLLYDKNDVGREYYDVVVAVIAAVAGVVMLLIYAKSPALAWFKPRKFVDRKVWVTGAGRAFLDSLPSRH